MNDSVRLQLLEVWSSKGEQGVTTTFVDSLHRNAGESGALSLIDLFDASPKDGTAIVPVAMALASYGYPNNGLPERGIDKIETFLRDSVLRNSLVRECLVSAVTAWRVNYRSESYFIRLEEFAIAAVELQWSGEGEWGGLTHARNCADRLKRRRIATASFLDGSIDIDAKLLDVDYEHPKRRFGIRQFGFLDNSLALWRQTIAETFTESIQIPIPLDGKVESKTTEAITEICSPSITSRKAMLHVVWDSSARTPRAVEAWLA